MTTFLFRSITHLEMDEERYLEYLLSHYGDLGLSYSFPVTLSFINSPLIAGGGLMVIEEEHYALAGAVGYVIGTGANEFQDTDVCQIEIIHLLAAYRGTRLLLQLLLQLLMKMREDGPHVQRVQFWAKPSERGTAKLFARIARMSGGQCTPRGDLTLYSVPYESLHQYCHSLVR